MRTFASTSRRHASATSARVEGSPPTLPPAFETSTSTGPSARIAAAASVTCSGSVRSATSGATVSDSTASLISSEARARMSARRPTIVTDSPASTSLRATAFPIPVPPPVTTARRAIRPDADGRARRAAAHSGPPRTMELDGRRAPAGRERGADDEQARACKAADRRRRAAVDRRHLEARPRVDGGRLLGVGGVARLLRRCLPRRVPLASRRCRRSTRRPGTGSGRRRSPGSGTGSCPGSACVPAVDASPWNWLWSTPIPWLRYGIVSGLGLGAGGRRFAFALELALVDADPLAQVRDRSGLGLRAGGRCFALELALVDADPLAQVRDLSGSACVPAADASPWNWLWSTPTPWLRYGIVPGSPG